MSSADLPAVSDALRARLAGTNISADTLLATDYLNHFNEIIMMLELVADMPEMLDDAKAWKPLSYVDHFRLSQFAERDLAIEVYELIPDPRRQAFEETIAKTHARIASGIGELSDAIASGDPSMVRMKCGEIAHDLHNEIDHISIIIHGGAVALDQPDIDGLMAKSGAAPQSQDDIDALFATAPSSSPASQDDIDKLFETGPSTSAPATAAMNQDDIDNLFK